MTSTTKKITTSAIMIALAAVLSLFEFVPFPNGGGVTIGSAVPIIIIALLYDTKWGLLTAFAYTLVNMLLKGVITTLPTSEFSTYALMIIIDYVLAFGVIGLAGFFARLMKESKIAVTISAAIVMILRFVCHYASGIILWGEYAPKGQAVPVYSLIYNGSYMVPEIIITTVIVGFLSVKIIPMLKSKSL